MTSISNTFDSGGGAIMQLLESKTIQGAEHDSSARYPPPKCHPETRQSLRGEILGWVCDPKRSWRMFYILGTAGVGKSAVAQSVADEVDCLGASCFISRHSHRHDPDGVIPTLVYQLAVRHKGYKQIISQKLGEDRSILRKARRVQFKQLLIEPFHTIMTLDPTAVQNPLLIIIDGLDECEDLEAQCEFIELIGDHVRTFLEFPLLWLICSRPESHLKYTLSQADFQVTCRRKEILVDDDEGRRDVSIYLENEFRKIRQRYPGSLGCDWPPEVQLQQIAGAASGLFAFASTITRFIGDADAGDPSSQLGVCMRILAGSNVLGVKNPYHTLDILYKHILTSIPHQTLPITKRILGMSILYPGYGPSQSARMQANFLRIGKVAFDHALKRLHSVLCIGSSSDAFESPIEFYHASFGDFLQDTGRSGEFCLGGPAAHYDVALTALSWHVDLGAEVRESDIWISPSEDPQTYLKSVKSESLVVLWKACSHVEGKNAMKLYQKLQTFDFNALGRRIPDKWDFDDFLNWLNLQEHDFSTRKLMNLIDIDEECGEVDFTDVTVPWDTTFRFTSQESRTIHLNLGTGNQCRHVHILHRGFPPSIVSLDVLLESRSGIQWVVSQHPSNATVNMILPADQPWYSRPATTPPVRSLTIWSNATGDRPIVVFGDPYVTNGDVVNYVYRAIRHAAQERFLPTYQPPVLHHTHPAVVHPPPSEQQIDQLVYHHLGGRFVWGGLSASHQPDQWFLSIR